MPSTVTTLLTAPLPESKLAKHLLCAVLLLLSITAHAAPILTVTSNQGAISLDGFSDLIEDPNKLYRIDDILSTAVNRQFRPAESGDFNLSQSIGRYWFRFTLSNTSNQIIQQLLQVMPVDLNAAQLYTEAGQHIAPMSTDDLIRTETLFSIPVNANSSTSYYLALEYPFDRQLELTLHDYTSFLGDFSALLSICWYSISSMRR
jgi:hypothetical protein